MNSSSRESGGVVRKAAEDRSYPVVRVGDERGPSRGDAASESASRDLRALGSMLRRRRALILTAIATVVSAVGLFTYLTPRVYESNATFLVEGGTPSAEVPTLAILERIGSGSRIENEIELVQSRRVIEPVVDSLDLHVTWSAATDGPIRPDSVVQITAGRDAIPGRYRVVRHGASGLRLADRDTGESIATTDSLVPIQAIGLVVSAASRSIPEVEVTVADFDVTVGEIRSRVSVGRVGRDSDLIRVVCSGPDPESARSLCDWVGRSYLTLRTDLQRTEATTARKFLSEQTARVGGSLREAEDSLSAYARRNRVVAPQDQASEDVRQLASLRAQRDLLSAEAASLATILADSERTPDGSSQYRNLAGFPSFARNEAITGLVTSLNELENERSVLAVRRSETNPDLAALDSRIVSIERQLQSIAESYSQSLQQQITSLDAILRRSGASLATLPVQQVEYARRLRQAQQLGELHALLQTRLREAEIAEAVNLPRVRVVDASSYPLEASAPRVGLNLGLGLLLGVLLGLTLAVAREHWDNFLHDKDEFERATGLPVLGMIPRTGKGVASHPSVTMLPESADEAVLEAGSAEDDASASPPAASGPAGLARGTSGNGSAPGRADWEVTLEAFRSLATDLRFLRRSVDDLPVRSVAVTSSTKGEGKTFTACNLALIQASFGTMTLLIDADLRFPSVTRFLGLPEHSAGFTDLLAGTASLSDVCRQVNIRDSFESLHVISAGSPNPQAMQIMRKPGGLAEVLDLCSGVFDFVVIDTPPLNVISETAVVASSVDAVLFVVRSGRSSTEAIRRSLERLARTSQETVAVVMNDVDLRDRYYYGYGEEYSGRR